MQPTSFTLCIPRVATSVSKEYIIQTIEKMHIGCVETIQEIPLVNNNAFNRIIIRIKWDTSSPQSQWIYDTLSENKSIKIVHSMPWYWICVKYVKQVPSRVYSAPRQCAERVGYDASTK